MNINEKKKAYDIQDAIYELDNMDDQLDDIQDEVCKLGHMHNEMKRILNYLKKESKKQNTIKE